MTGETGPQPTKANQLSHSYLYHLEPIGIRTPYVEALTSYAARLAQAHRLSVGSFIRGLIIGARTRGKEVNHVEMAREYPHHADGLDNTARYWVQALEKLTLQQGLQSLTMLRWSCILNNLLLIRRHLAWCPYCYQEWWPRGQHYIPLLWRLQHANVCPVHRAPLVQRCIFERCGRTIPVFSVSEPFGFCPYCKHWLGESANRFDDVALPPDTPDRLKQLWVAQQLGELLADTSDLTHASPRSVAYTLETISYAIAGGSFCRLATMAGIQRDFVAHYVKTQNISGITNLLQLCQGLGISLSKLLTGTILQEEPFRSSNALLMQRQQQEPDRERVGETLESTLHPQEQPPRSYEIAGRSSVKRTRPQRSLPTEHRQLEGDFRKIGAEGVAKSCPCAHRQLDVEAIRLQFEALLEPGLPFLPVGAIAHQLGCSTKSLRYHFPDLYEQASRHWKEYVAQYKNNSASLRRRFNLDQVRRVLAEILNSNEDPPLSLSEAASQAHHSVRTLKIYLPDLCDRIRDRFREYKTSSVSHHRPKCCKELDLDGVEVALRAALASNTLPPPSLSALAAELGCNVNAMKKRFPDLCEQIVHRCWRYRKTGPPRLDRDLDTEAVGAEIQHILDSAESPISWAEVARRLRISRATLRRHFPKLHKQVTECFRLYRTSNRRIPSKTYHKFNPFDVKAALETALEEAPPLPLIKLASRIGHTRETLRTHFPELCDQVVARYRAYQGLGEMGRAKTIVKIDLEQTRAELEAILSSHETPPPSMNQVIFRLRHNSRSLKKYFPDLCNRLSERYWEWRRKSQQERELLTYQPKLRHRLDIEQTKEVLDSVLKSNEFPPPSMREVASRIGYAYSCIQTHLPNECKQISTRYKQYAEARSAERLAKLCKEVQVRVLKLHSEGIYPGTHRFGHMLRESQIYAVYKKTVSELGYSQTNDN